MRAAGAWEIPSLSSSVKNFKWGIFAFPKMDGTLGRPVIGAAQTMGFASRRRSLPAKLFAAG
jgi:raffinose/stachyose/melibiose transport system substrate-binding protein